MPRITRLDKPEPLRGKDRREKKGLVQMTVEIPYQLDVRLEAQAAFQKMRRSDLVKKYLDQGLRNTNFDKIVRSGLPESELQMAEDE